ncbi:hypothetical protein [Methylosinus sp. Sm6]|uniref:hypothetical protein n=1 Tax=Methylosinus sp. Sm6 TaxID=2866948 RepID=UPI001C99F4BA|nr:hypothetical protein [Methylosinus sp. Sm6]MBY6243869.1 hypothetical protein [Methylosinus sp. Sm6]
MSLTDSSTTPTLKGYRTLLINAVFAALPALLSWAVGVNWSDYVSAPAAVAIISIANMGLRVITTTPIGKPA